MTQCPKEKARLLELEAESLVRQAASWSSEARNELDRLEAHKKSEYAEKLRNDARAKFDEAKRLREDNYPKKPAKGKTDTSRKAAVKLEPKIGALHQVVLDALAARDMTNSEIVIHTGRMYHTLQPRTGELCRMGKVFDSGERRKNSRGNPEIVWTLIDPKAAKENQAELELGGTDV